MVSAESAGTKMERNAYCNLLVIAITCWFSWLGFRSPDFEEKYLFWPEAILSWKQRYRLLTSGFLHLDGVHLCMNMVSLYFFGPLIETMFGPIQFLTIYLGAIVGGNLLALYMHRYHDYRALGASGGVAGIIFAYVLLFPGGALRYPFLPIAIPAWLYAITYLLASFYGMKTGNTRVGHDAHLGGALVGLFTAAAFHPMAVRYNALLFSFIAIGTLLLFIYLAKNPMFLPMEGFDFTKWKTPHQPGPSFKSIFKIPRWTRRATSASSSAPPDKRIDAILQRIAEHGINSLTDEEKRLLNDTSAKYRRRAIRENPKWGFPI
jgi:membrane associated rhomboid family serine protease